MKNPLTPAGIEPATFWVVAQHLNHCATALPWYQCNKQHVSNHQIVVFDSWLIQLYFIKTQQGWRTVWLLTGNFPTTDIMQHGVPWHPMSCHLILTLHSVNSYKGQADGRRPVRGTSAKDTGPSAVQAWRRHLGMHVTRIVLVEVVQNPVTRCFSHNQISSHALNRVSSECRLTTCVRSLPAPLAHVLGLWTLNWRGPVCPECLHIRPLGGEFPSSPGTMWISPRWASKKPHVQQYWLSMKKNYSCGIAKNAAYSAVSPHPSDEYGQEL